VERETSANHICLDPDCRRFEAEVAAYLEGEPGTSVEAHAARCGECRSVLEELKLLRATASELPLESPSPRLWTSLRNALRAEGLIQESPSSWRSWLGQFRLQSRWAVAGTAAALALAIVIVSSSQHRKHRVTVAESAAPVAANYAAEQASLERTVNQMEQDYRAQVSSLDPAARGDYQKGLESLNDSIRECSETLREAPENSLARQYLMEAYAQKATVLASALEYEGR
jgi:hypothetical protein